MVNTKVKGFVLAVIFWALFVPRLAEAQAPKLVMEENYFNFPTVMEGASVNHSFTVLNNGDAPLQIMEVKPS